MNEMFEFQNVVDKHGLVFKIIKSATIFIKFVNCSLFT